MILRLSAVLLLAAVSMSACTSGSDVPGDQVLQPIKAPAGWTSTKFDDLSIATPSGWTKGATQKATETMDTTTWRAAPVAGADPGGAAPSGVEVREISRPQQNAKKAARALAISATATMQGGAIEPVPIAWPNAETAYYLSYDAVVGEPDQQKTYVTRTVVFDLANGHQVQVTSVAEKGSDVKVPDRVLSTVKLVKPPSK